MASLMGTELFQAYEDAKPPSNPINNPINIDVNDTQHTMNANSSSVPPTTMPPNHPDVQIPNQQNQFYDSTNIYNNDANLQEQLAILQYELAKQKEVTAQNLKENESLIDRFVSKKKEVFKLVIMALTILLAISIHYVMSDLIKNYMVNNDLTNNQEFTTRIAYPITVLLIIWVFKVFNK